MKKVFGIIKKLSPLLSAIPGVGPILANVLDNNSTKPGVIDTKEAIPQVIQLVILAVLLYLAMKGHLTWDEIERAKDFISD